jgi:hypothetical protein
MRGALRTCRLGRCLFGICGHAGLLLADTWIVACHQQSACSPRCTRAAVAACPPLVKVPRAHRLEISIIDGLDSE